MAERRPLVLVNGQLLELPVGDTLPGTGGGGVSTTMRHNPPVTLSGGQGTIPVPGGYTPGFVLVEGEGHTLVRDVDYIDADGMNIVLTVPVEADKTEQFQTIVFEAVSMVASLGRFPFFLHNGSRSYIGLTEESKLPFFMKDGSANDISLST